MAATTTSSTSLKHIVILGGSYGGVSISHYFLKHVLPKLPDRSSYQLILISASCEAMCRPACPRAMISDDMFAQEKLFVNIPNLFTSYPSGSFRFIHGAAAQLDHANRTITVHHAAGAPIGETIIPFHALVIATGASTPSPLHGFNCNDSAHLKAAWVSFRKALLSARTIVIAGGGPAGVETAGELGDYLNSHSGGWFDLSSNSSANATPVQIQLVTAGPQILPLLRPAIAKKAETYLTKLGVSLLNGRVASVEPAGAGTDVGGAKLTSKATVTLEDGRNLEADLYIPATGTVPNTAFVEKTLLAADGRVQTNPSTLRVDAAGPRIYAVGDVSTVARPAVHLILAAVPVLCANMKRDLLIAAGKDEVGEDRVFKEDTRETQMVPIGKSRGVGAAMGYQLPSFMVWLIKGRDYWLWTTGGLWSGKQWAKES